MSNEEDPDFTPDECRRWIRKLQGMSITLDKKGDGDGAKMFATAAVLVEHMAVEIQRERLLAEFGNPFGNIIGEA